MTNGLEFIIKEMAKTGKIIFAFVWLLAVLVYPFNSALIGKIDEFNTKFFLEVEPSLNFFGRQLAAGAEKIGIPRSSLEQFARLLRGQGQALLGETGLSQAEIARYAKISASSSQLIAIASSSDNQSALDLGFDLSELEKLIHELINHERIKNSLPALKWNDDAAAAGRLQSLALAEESQPLTDLEKTCDYPLIHHEGLKYGDYHSDRLNSLGTYYFSKSGENIALVPALKKTIYYSAVGDQAVSDGLDACFGRQSEINQAFKASVENDSLSFAEKKKLVLAEIDKHAALLAEELSVKIAKIEPLASSSVAAETVTGWMNSPGHRANILDHDFDEAGIGAAYVNGYMIFTQVFITRTDCGFLGGACCRKAGYLPYCFVPLECEKGKCYSITNLPLRQIN